MTASRYIGRFAPSPSGPLHFGSLVAAAASFYDARAAGGQWLLRIDDLDQPRCVPGAAEAILATLVRLGLEWDAEPQWQSRRHAAYAAAFERLREAGHLFPCACSRSELADSALARDGSRIYPGTCRAGLLPGRSPRTWRVRSAGTIHFEDRIQGALHENLERDVGDFVVQRADNVFAYQLAAVVDDAAAGVTHVVRGADLLGSTSRQIHLQHLLGHAVPRHAHVPIAADRHGDKLSKQTHARAIDALKPEQALMLALEFLGQEPPSRLEYANVRTIHAWAIEHWSIARIPRRISQPAPAFFHD